MAKAKTVSAVRCTGCGHTEPRWLGRCPACQAWGSMTEDPVERPRAGHATASARPIADVPLEASARIHTGLAELDRVLGGGLVAGEVVLLGGEPGSGKSTLLLQVAQEIAAGGRTVLYVSAEESCEQVRGRAERLGALHPRLLLAAEDDVVRLMGLVATHAPAVVVVDSIQTVQDPETPGAPGGVAQVRACAARIVSEAKRRGTAVFLVGHVTKDGQLAGPRVLEHLVDAVCDLEGDRHHALRLVRAVKNRFGPAGEVGCFTMGDAGLSGVDDAGRLFVGDAPPGTTGIVVTVALEGRRALPCEVQALAVSTTLSQPRRVASGIDAARLSLLVAVLGERTDVALSNHDVYAASVGGLRLVEPAVDLAVCIALASSCRGVAAPRGVVVLGEVGLAGDLRLVAHVERRLAEAARMGFAGALLPAAYDGPDHGLRLRQARNLHGAIAAVLGA
jgi:DNA repair protein RadA/Sms